MHALLSQILQELPGQLVGAFLEKGVEVAWDRLTDSSGTAEDRTRKPIAPRPVEEYAVEEYALEVDVEVGREVRAARAVAEEFFTALSRRRYATAFRHLHPATGESVEGQLGLRRRFRKAPPPTRWSLTDYAIWHRGMNCGLQVIATVCFGDDGWTSCMLTMVLEDGRWTVGAWTFDFRGCDPAA